MAGPRRAAQRLWLALPDGGGAPRYLPLDIELRAADLLTVAGRWDRVDACYRRFLDLLAGDGFPRERARVESFYGMFLETRGDHPGALRHSAAAVTLYQQLGDDAGLAYALGNTGAVYLELSRFAEAQDCFERQRDLCSRAGDEIGLSRAYGNNGIVCTDTGRYDEALEHLGRQRELCERLGDKRGLARAEGNIGLVCWHREDYRRAREQFELTMRLAREVGDVRMMAITVGNIGLIQGETGDLQGAIDSYRQQLDLALRLGERSMAPLARENIANELIRLGQFTEAAALLDQAGQGHRAQGDSYGEARVMRLRADWHKGQGEHAAAGQAMERALALLRPLGIGHDLGDFLLDDAEILSLLGKPSEALAAAAEAEGLYREQQRPGPLLLAWLWRLKLSFEIEPARRADLAGQIEALLERDPDPGFQAQVLYELCAMQRALGRPWRETRDRALTIYRDLYEAVSKHAYRRRIDILMSMNSE
ncbi:MAG: tetratricopeptide repeat protein [Candidatus Edwardsbacteria bacterium]|jgi:tetratricopeptide (TPR) repeat protein|nr:tetratricopeptide repeat protein [Candidatus Edwardsbacteria bacterium]